MNRLRITITKNSNLLNCMDYYTVQIDTSSSLDRVNLFEESFFSFQGQTIFIEGTLVNCSIWDSIKFDIINENDTIINSLSYTRSQVDSDLATIPCTIGEYIEAKYQLIKV